MKVSVLDLVPVRQGQSYREAIGSMVRLAQDLDGLGYERLWIAEHHNAPSLASSATQLLISEALAHTERIRVGPGGVMLPNHSPYIVAEQYGTLETLYPGRVDLGLGRAPGTDQQTAMALRRHQIGRETQFPQELLELRGYFEGTNPVSAYPAKGLNVPMIVLGSSTDSAHLAANLGLPYSFASHFAPAMMDEAVEIYRREFKPSKYAGKPYVIIGVNASLADSDAEAEKLFTSQIRMFLGIVTNKPQPLQAPADSMESLWRQHAEDRATASPHFGPVAFDPTLLIGRERAVVEQMASVSLVGNSQSVGRQIRELKQRVEFDELMAVSYIFDERAEKHSFELLGRVVLDAG